MTLRVLDALRGLAALYVVIYHATGLLWDTGAPLAHLVRGVFSFGGQAVLLFFIISGFCIHYRQAKAGATRLDVRGFAWRRLRRLYPPLLLAIAATAAFDWLGGQLNEAVYAGGATSYQTPAEWSTVAHAPVTLLGNLLFQGRLLVTEFGSDVPLWSLSLEFWFYVLYPLALVLFARFGARRGLLVASLAGAAMQFAFKALVADGSAATPALLLPIRVLLDWPVWLIGAAIAEAHARGLRWAPLRRLGPVAILCLGGMAVLTRVAGEAVYVPNLAWATCFGGALAYVMLEGGSGRWRVPRLVRSATLWLGDISYSLYLLHYPFLLLLLAWWTAAHADLPRGPELAAVGIVAALGLGWFGWWAVERHCVPARADGARAGQPAIAEDNHRGSRRVYSRAA